MIRNQASNMRKRKIPSKTMRLIDEKRLYSKFAFCQCQRAISIIKIVTVVELFIKFLGKVQHISPLYVRLPLFFSFQFPFPRLAINPYSSFVSNSSTEIVANFPTFPAVARHRAPGERQPRHVFRRVIPGPGPYKNPRNDK